MKTLAEVCFYGYIASIALYFAGQLFLRWKFPEMAALQKEIEKSEEMKQLAKAVQKERPFLLSIWVSGTADVGAVSLAIWAGVYANVGHIAWTVFTVACIAIHAVYIRKLSIYYS